MAIKVLLDTDIGSDIDDALALAWLLSTPECELLGVTTVTGEASRRAELASVLCREAGKAVPIFPGAEQPLLVEQRQPMAPQAAVLKAWPHETGFPGGRAVAFLRDTIREHPGEIVLLSIGPLTNVALLFALDPEVPRLLKGLVSMCGVFTNQAAGWGPREWNAMLDPHATAMVYRHAPPFHLSIGLDVTSRVFLGEREARSRLTTGLLRPVADFAGEWFRHSDRIFFHDPLAAVTVFHPEVCVFKRGTVEVELASERVAGMTLWTPAPAGRHEVAVDVDPDRFFRVFFSPFT